MNRFKLLIVDDERDLADNLNYDLRELDADILTASNGKEALMYLEREDFDCILSDINMPGMNGLSFGEALLKKEIKTPIVFYTAHGDEALFKEIEKLKPFDIIHKPYRPEDLNYIILEAFLYNKERINIKSSA